MPRVLDGSDGTAYATLNEYAYERLRTAIVTLQLAPGQGVSQAELVELLGTGWAGVRYATQRLAAERLLRVVPRGKTFISPLDIAEVQQAYQVRTSLDALAGRLAARRATEDNIASMRRSIEAAQLDLDAGELVAASVHLHRFYEEMAQSTRNEILQSQLRVVTGITERFEYYRASQLKLPPGSLEDHVALLAAIEAHDPDLAQMQVQQEFGARRWRTSVAELADISLTVRSDSSTG